MDRTINKKEFWQTVGMLVLVIPFFEPMSFVELADKTGGILRIIDQLFDMWKMFSSVVILTLYLFGRTKVKLSVLIVLFVAYWGIIFVSTLYNSGNVISVCLKAVHVLALAILLEMSIDRQKLSVLMHALWILLSSYIIINFLTICIFPQGMYSYGMFGYQDIELSCYWFLGNRNGHAFIFLFALFCGCLYDYLKFHRIRTRTWVVCGIVFISSLLVWSATSLVAVSVSLLLLIIGNNNTFFKFISPVKIWLASASVSILIIIFQVQKYLDYFIVYILKRDITFSKRTKIWDYALTEIKSNFLLGKGIEYDDYMRKTIHYDHMHNQYLDTTYMGGIFLLILYCIILWLCLKKINQCNNIYLKRIFTAAFSGYFVLFIAESRRSLVQFFMMLVLSYYIVILDNKEKNADV